METYSIHLSKYGRGIWRARPVPKGAMRDERHKDVGDVVVIALRTMK
jgi:hypothetical protein